MIHFTLCKNLLGNLISRAYFLDIDVISKVGTGHAIIAGAKDVITLLWKHYKMCNLAAREGEMSAPCPSGQN